MQWIAPSEKDAATDTLEKRLWEAANQFRANSGLTSAQYSTPVLGLIFLRFADVRFAARKGRSLQERATPILQGPAELKATLDDQTQNLCRTRDLLLPRLLSGQMELEKESIA